jgi:hypothetical protein
MSKIAIYKQQLGFIKEKLDSKGGFDKSLFAGVAFISFNTQEGRRRMEKVLGHTLLSLIWEWIRVKIFRRSKRLHRFLGKSLQVSRAAEPSEIFWENLNIPLLRKIKLATMTFIATSIVIVICFLITYYMTKYKVNIELELPKASL